MLIDSHVNLHAPAFDADREAVIERAQGAGIGLMVNICDRLDRFEAVTALAQAHPDIYATVGVHPHEAKDFPDLAVETLCILARRARVVGIGETGLDFHYDLSPRETQAQVFVAHIAAARQTGLPLIVHTREADEVTGDMLEVAHAEGPFRLLMHCYTSGEALARRMAALGAWFSFSGIGTFRNAKAVRDIFAALPEDRIIVETDCPYLAPVPLRGRRNEPAFLPHVLAALASVRGWSVAEAEARTEANFFNLFNRIPRPVDAA